MIANIGSFEAPNVSNENENIVYQNVIFTTCRSQPGNSGSGGLALEYNKNNNVEARIIGVLTWGMSIDKDDPAGMVGFGWVQHKDTVLKGMQDIFHQFLSSS